MTGQERFEKLVDVLGGKSSIARRMALQTKDMGDAEFAEFLKQLVGQGEKEGGESEDWSRWDA